MALVNRNNLIDLSSIVHFGWYVVFLKLLIISLNLLFTQGIEYGSYS